MIAADRIYVLDKLRTCLMPITTLDQRQVNTFGAVAVMLEDRNGDMWFGTTQAGVVHLSHRDGSVEIFRHRPGQPSSLASDRVLALFQDARGDIWVGLHDALPAIILRGEETFIIWCTTLKWPQVHTLR